MTTTIDQKNNPSHLKPTDPSGPTGTVVTWLAATELEAIPKEVQERGRHLLLDGIGCLLVGSHLEWSELGVEAITGFDEGGSYMIAGWDKQTNAYSAAMLNSSFIQGFELDDYFPAAPLHSNSIVVPAMLPILEKNKETTGADCLLALLLGYEVGTRVGLALHGPDMLSRGWHSGAVFGGAAAAASAGKLLHLSAAAFEDAIGIASTQACGLMSAQFESMIKRMQHGFAARNGLYGAVLAERGYVGIKRVFEREYGGFLPVFGEGHNPDASQITLNLGSEWNTTAIAVKPYAAMGGLHAAIDACRALRGEKSFNADQVKLINVEVGGAAFEHGGFDIQRPIQPITAQMSMKYCVSVALLDGDALLKQFSIARINADDVWALIGKVGVCHEKGFDEKPHTTYTTRVTITYQNGNTEQQQVETPTGGTDHPLSNAEIVSKFLELTSSVIEKERSAQILDVVLGIDRQKNITELLDLLKKPARNALA